MRALMLKDFYVLKKVCYWYLIILVVFSVGNIMASKNSSLSILSLYPVFLAGLLPMTLMAYDEKEKWSVYSQIMPCSKRDYVVSKYLTGLILELVVAAALAVTHTINLVRYDVFDIGNLLSYTSLILCFGVIPSAIMLPFLFKLGVEKGRLGYTFVSVFTFLLAGIVSNIKSIGINASITDFSFVAALAPAVVIWLASLLISIKIYNKREIV